MATAGVGITFTDVHPFTVLEVRSSGPAAVAANRGLLNIGDVLEQVDKTNVAPCSSE